VNLLKGKYYLMMNTICEKIFKGVFYMENIFYAVIVFSFFILIWGSYCLVYSSRKIRMATRAESIEDARIS
jgi:hypothetical protein